MEKQGVQIFAQAAPGPQEPSVDLGLNPGSSANFQCDPGQVTRPC